MSYEDSKYDILYGKGPVQKRSLLIHLSAIHIQMLRWLVQQKAARMIQDAFGFSEGVDGTCIIDVTTGLPLAAPSELTGKMLQDLIDHHLLKATSSQGNKGSGQYFIITDMGLQYNEQGKTDNNTYLGDVTGPVLSGTFNAPVYVNPSQRQEASHKVIDPPSIDRAQLRRLMVTRCSRSEIEAFIFDMNIPAYLFRPGSLADMVVDLISYCERTQRFAELIQNIRASRPDIFA